MANTRKSTTKMRGGDLGGFTIIEVVLVLAIAGLIFLMVFIALPALQRSQRDTQRRNDMSALASQITQYQSNNNGKLPKPGSVQDYDESDTSVTMETWSCLNMATDNSAQCFIRNYMNASGAAENTFKDPDGYYYGLNFHGNMSSGVTMPTEMDYTIHVWDHARCGENESVVKSDNARDYVIVYKLEGAGTYCNDNA